VSISISQFASDPNPLNLELWLKAATNSLKNLAGELRDRGVREFWSRQNTNVICRRLLYAISNTSDT